MAVKKVDVKKIAKASVSNSIKLAFEQIAIPVEDGQDFGFTEGTLVLHMANCDVQVKVIAPKAGLDRYVKLEVEEEVEETPSEDKAE